MKVSVSKPGSPGDVLEHHGKKGMKWGVRNAYEARISRGAARNRRVGEGGGSFRDKARTHLSTSNARLMVSKGFQDAALNRAISTERHVQRMKTGKANVIDQLRFIGNVRPSDIVRGATGHA